MHKRLGHLTFFSLRALYPKLHVNLDLSKSQCKVGELLKSHHISHPLSSKRSEIPFSHIHTDV